MSKKLWLGLFFLALLIELLCIQFYFTNARFISKPLLVLLLIGYFLSSVRRVAAPLKVGVVLALGFSWIGDILLLFEYQSALYFILGLSSFLIAHLFYIHVFHSIRSQQHIPVQAFLLIPVAIYYGMLIGLLYSHLGDMQLPVYVYGLVICAMLFMALHLYSITVNHAGGLFILGALLFILSDSVLAINKFYTSFHNAGIIIMLSYGLAQWCITEGAIRIIIAAGQQQGRPVVVSA